MLQSGCWYLAANGAAGAEAKIRKMASKSQQGIQRSGNSTHSHGRDQSVCVPLSDPSPNKVARPSRLDACDEAGALGGY
jgi:hypothetical protein